MVGDLLYITNGMRSKLFQKMTLDALCHINRRSYVLASSKKNRVALSFTNTHSKEINKNMFIFVSFILFFTGMITST